MQYAYAWYEMFGIMLGAGVAIFLVVKGLDLALDRLLNVMAARRDRRLAEEIREAGFPQTADALTSWAKGLRRLGEQQRKNRDSEGA